ncbi:VCBS repeat-containing protein [Streptomyces sp. NPDC002057]|uniref:FG-GAP repeat domain-containing protein n=1 Tax=Streptomyces sp. NPDC002057 TaxID=3154664 RepID=UPI00332C7B5E
MLVYDMATGAPPATIKRTDAAGIYGDIQGAAGGTVLGVPYDDSGPNLISSDGGRTTTRHVAGIPSNGGSWLSGKLTDAALASYYDPAIQGEEIAVVDLATAAVVDSYKLDHGPTGRYFPQNTYLSSRQVAWLEADAGKAVLATALRGQKSVRRVPLGPDTESWVTGGLVGDSWFAFAATPFRGTVSTAFTALSLSDGSRVELLDQARNVTQGPDGTLLAIGSTEVHGEGVYEIRFDAHGKPAARLVASMEKPDDATTPVTYVGGGAPALLDLDGLSRTRLTWQFSSNRADFSVELRSRTTGKVFQQTLQPVAGSTGTGVYPDGRVRLDWAGEVADSWGAASAAPNGAYEWKVTAKPWNGLPDATSTGTFTVVRTPQVHDYSDNGSPDLLVRQPGGGARWVDTRWDDVTGRLVEVRGIGYSQSGWDVYDSIESVGDVAGAAAPDTVTRDRSGVLWLHQGRGSNYTTPYEPRVRVGGGWHVYDRLAGGSDLTGDRRADLVATDKAGDLYLYAGTGKASAPFAPRKKIGHGWGIYNQLTATGDIGGSPAGDLVARDKAGVLWLYLGNGDGTYGARTRIGGGWGVYADIVGIGDANEDGRLDLYTRTSTNAAYLYEGTGDTKIPFEPRSATGVGVATGSAEYDQVS